MSDTPDLLPDEEICGWSYDHDLVLVHEDPGLTQWECRRCGAEIVETKR